MTTTKETRIAEIEQALWIMEFKDHWTNEDWIRRDALRRELNELKGR